MEDLRNFIRLIIVKNTVIYIHGRNGSADEAEFYKPIFSGYDIIGLEYKSETPWQAKTEFPKLYDEICAESNEVILIANSIGAYFAMHSLAEKRISKAFFISPMTCVERFMSVWNCQEMCSQKTPKI